MKQPYRKLAEILEPDPFPAAEARKADEVRKVKRVALLARKLVAVTRAADFAREAFPEAHALRRTTSDMVLRSFENLESAVEEWKKLEVAR